jgi:hypothetical protein
VWKPVALLAALFALNILIQSLVQRWIIRREYRRREAEMAARFGGMTNPVGSKPKPPSPNTFGLALFLCLAAAGVCRANELPDSPAPKLEIVNRTPRPDTTPRFWDRTNKVEFGAMVGLAAWDMGQTCDFLAHGERELYLTQSCPKNIAITAGIDAGATLTAWLLHKTGHHKLERLPMLYFAGNSLYGVIVTKTRK